MSNIIVTILEKLKLTAPFRNEKSAYILMHDKDSGEVSAVPVDAVLAKVNDRVNAIIYPDGFTKTTPVNRVGNTVTIAPNDFAWRIELNPYTNADEFEQILLPTTSPELKRIDTLAATKQGTIVYYLGVEDEFVIRPPDIRTDELRITDLTIFGDEVQEHTEPIVTEIYTLAEKEKLALLDPTADIDKPVSTAQAAADANTLAVANAYTDSKVVGIYKFKGNKTDYADLIATTGMAIGDVYNLLSNEKNYGWTGTVWDDLGGSFDVSGKEDITNKTDVILGNETSSVLYASIKGIVDWFTAAKIKSILGITTLSGSNTGDQDLSGLQSKDTQVLVGASTNVQNSWSGKTVYFTANCTITVPSTLDAAFLDFGFRTMTGVTVTWAITAPFTWETTPTTTPEKTDGLFTRYNAGNSIIIRW